MPDLSHAAQAVYDAYREQADNPYYYERSGLVAALHAAADQVISSLPPPCEDFDEYAQGFRAAHVKYRNELLAISEELKAW